MRRRAASRGAPGRALRVLVDGTPVRHGVSGTAVYAERLLPELAALGIEVHLRHDPRRGPPGGGPRRAAANLAADAAWLARGLPRLADDLGADVVHHLLPARARTRVPQVVTVHDLAAVRRPDDVDERWRRVAVPAHRRAARAAAAVIAVSQTTATDVRVAWDVPAGRIVVARHGARTVQAANARRVPPGAGGVAPPGPAGAPADHPPTTATPPEGLPRVARPFVLYVGDDEPRKAVDALRVAHARLRERDPDAPDLVLAGRVAAPGRLQAPGQHHVGVRDADELADLRDRALALVHPARHEGVGLGVLEAMAAGLPVLAGRAPGLVETAGDAALYCDPHDPEDLVGALRRIAADDALRAELAERGRARAAERSWARSAQAHRRAYTLAAGRA